MTALAIHPLTPARWDDFVALFETDSICRMCRCVHHRLPADVRKETDPKSRKSAMAKIVEKGPPPGLLAYIGKDAVGWIAIAPRPATPDWNISRKASAAALVDAGLEYAKKNGARLIEACPMAYDDKRSVTGLFVGPKRVFDRAGFHTVIERKPGRPLMRRKLGKTETNRKAAAKTSAPAGKARAR